MENLKLEPRDLEFLKKLGQDIAAQNNRGTAMPHFYVLMEEYWLPAPHDMGDEYVRYDYNSGEPIIYKTKEEAEADGRDWEELLEIGQHHLYRESNVFLTEDGYNQHVRLNGHNYGRGGNKFFSYVKHAFRNPEMARLVEILVKIGGQDEKTDK